MCSKTLLPVLLSTITAFAGEHMTISVCNLGGVPNKIIARAEHVVAEVFSLLQIEVGWADCEELGPGLNMILRLRREGPLGAERNDSPEVMSSTVAAFAGERMDVTVCNVGHIPDTAIEHAEIQAAYVFRAADVENHWTSRGVELLNPRIARPDRGGLCIQSWAAISSWVTR